MPAAGLLFALLLQVAGGAAPSGASISGRVIDKASGQPLPRMAVTVYGANRAMLADTITDAQGRYLLGGLAAGKYGVVADNDDRVSTYLKQWFGVDEPSGALSPSPAPNIDLAAGESRANVDIAMTRALAIEGRVLDQFGDAVRRAEVLATRADGRTPALSGAANTNDVGAYRVFGLVPGRYRVCAIVNDARTCYPDVSVTSQDSLNIDIHLSGGASPDPTPASASSPDSADTATIRGVVVDKASGRPIPRATVRLGFRGASGPPGDLTATTNDAGVFSFTGLTPGSYNGFATAAGHVLTTLRDQDHGWEFMARKGQTFQLTVALPRAYAMMVRLVDASDTPISGVRVSVHTLDGRPAAATSGLLATDDRGRARIPELAPGQYIVCAEPDASPGGSRHVSQRKSEQLLRTCYPSARNEADAQPVTLGDADIEDLEIRIARGRTLSISGRIVDSAGAPAPHASVQFTRYTTSGTLGSGFGIGADATFVIADVQPGAYAIEATTDRETAFVPVRVDEDDIAELVVAMRRTTTVPGRFVVDDPSTALPPAAGRAPLSVSTRLADDRLLGSGSSIHATANSDNTFTLTGVFGRRRIDVTNPPDGWFVKAVRYGATDVTDAAVEFRDDATPLEVVLSNHGAIISGTVVDVTDKQVTRARVLLIRSPVSKEDTPHLVETILSVSGTYNFRSTRSGDYSIVAVPDDTPTSLPADSDRLTALWALGQRVIVTDLDRLTIELHVTTVR